MRKLRVSGISLLILGALFLAACGAPGTGDADVTAEPNGNSSGEVPSSGLMTEVPGDTAETAMATPAVGAEGTPEGTPGAMIPMTGMEDFDRMFIDMMAPHHQSAIEMARIALERAQHPEIRQIAENIVSSQQAEIDQLLAWREAWYGSRQTPPMSAMPMLTSMEGMGGVGQTMDMQVEVEKLRNTSGSFDLAFIEAMIPHHQQAIEAALMALQLSQQTELKDMAQQIIADQQREIDDLERIRLELGGAPASTATP